MKTPNISRHITLPVDAGAAYTKFIAEIERWWPKNYTWSGNKLVSMTIEPEVNGRCTETGPHNFSCDWGRVIYITNGSSIAISWQISPERIPEPDPEKASEVFIHFQPEGPQKVKIDFGHRHFDNHGEGAAAYREALNSKDGWDFILQCFADYCRQ
ncbi:hypothetical protein [Chitinophaga nivalis]|uniref:ATPase n=1 Tax=Chitinophaga nivalis TaxID=2991709 RepID=A0ABT3IMR2_9BACT|nr:hypothetical protein [Chitinophaga nivalis]MCW3465112.1 hypothetical protein [Chitinophaga nivalis]MCW3485196.1 hypothetical protein [Chitinophaga nivalis]